MNKFFIKNILSLLLALGVLLPGSVLASQVSFQPASLLSPQEKPYTVTVLLNTEGESINTLEGVVKVDKELGDVVSVTDSGSIITYWVERPQWNAGTRTISFSGAIPGGYSGTTGVLFSVVLPAYSGPLLENAVSFSSIKALRNDGIGSEASVTKKSFSISKNNSLVDPDLLDQLYVDGNKKDNIPPEIFSPQLSQDERVFNNQWFINFATTDKQSGIDYYEIQETRSGALDAGNWKRAESPYLLEDQELHSFIYVLAIDRQGNERVIKVFPRKPLAWYAPYQWPAVGTAIIIVLIVVGAVVRRRYTNRPLNNIG